MKKVCATGPGSAKPVVSMTTRSNCSSPLRRFSANSCKVLRKSSRMVQHTQPLLICTMCSWVSLTRMSLSMFSSPNSFSMTAIFWPCASLRMRLSSVVLPAPRKPVRMVAGIRDITSFAFGCGALRANPYFGRIACAPSRKSNRPSAWRAKRPALRGCTGSRCGQGQPPNSVRR